MTLGKSPVPTDAKRSLRDHQAPGDGLPLAHQPVVCHWPVKGRGVVWSSRGSAARKSQGQVHLIYEPALGIRRAGVQRRRTLCVQERI